MTPVRLLAPVGGYELFDEASGTKHLKPDFEAACQVTVDGSPAAMVLGSGSSPARMLWSLLRLRGSEPLAVVADMSDVYSAVAQALSVGADFLNLEGACTVGGVLRWYHRGLPSAGLPSASVDVDLTTCVLAAALGEGGAANVTVSNPRYYDLGAVDGVGLAVTDVVALPGGKRRLPARQLRTAPTPATTAP